MINFYDNPSTGAIRGQETPGTLNLETGRLASTGWGLGVLVRFHVTRAGVCFIVASG